MAPPDAPTVLALPHARKLVLLHSQVAALSHARRMPLVLLFPSALTALLATQWQLWVGGGSPAAGDAPVRDRARGAVQAGPGRAGWFADRKGVEVPEVALHRRLLPEGESELVADALGGKVFRGMTVSSSPAYVWRALASRAWLASVA